MKEMTMNNDQICKNCRFWGVVFEGVCDKIGDDYMDSDSSFDIEWDALDDSGLELYFKTGPNFGCVHFSHK